MACEECVQECLTILRLMKGDKWEPAHAGFYGPTLREWPDDVARSVVNRCANTMTFRPSRAELIGALQASDGRPGPEEAWGMIPKSEDETAVLTDEMLYASAASQPLLDDGDRIAARMAFKERYTQLVSEARAAGVPVNWQASLGYDKMGRDGPIKEAYAKGRLTRPRIAGLLGPSVTDDLLSSGMLQTQYLLPGEDSMPMTIRELAGQKALR